MVGLAAGPLEPRYSKAPTVLGGWLVVVHSGRGCPQAAARRPGMSVGAGRLDLGGPEATRGPPGSPAPWSRRVGSPLGLVGQCWLSGPPSGLVHHSGLSGGGGKFYGRPLPRQGRLRRRCAISLRSTLDPRASAALVQALTGRLAPALSFVCRPHRTWLLGKRPPSGGLEPGNYLVS
jgi:hypothetical protein